MTTMSLDRLSLMQSKHNRNNTLSDRKQSRGKKKIKGYLGQKWISRKKTGKMKMCRNWQTKKNRFLRPRYKFGVKKV